MKKKEIIFILTVGIIIGSIFAGYGSYAATTYAIHSEKVEYKDSTNNTITNVQAAIDGTCSNISSLKTKINDIEGNSLKVALRTSSTFQIEYANQHLSKDLTFTPVDGTIVAAVPYILGGYPFSYSVNSMTNGTIQVFVNSSTALTNRSFRILVFYK